MSVDDGLVFKFLSQGKKHLVDDLDEVTNKTKHTANVFARSADAIGDGAKKIAKDFDVMGDEGTRGMLKMVDAAGGLTAAIASGGLTAAIGIAAAAFSVYTTMVQSAAEKTRVAQEAVQGWTEASAKLAEQIVKTQNAGSKELDEQRRVALETVRLNGLKMGALLTAYRLQQAIAEAQQKESARTGSPIAAWNAYTARNQVEIIEKEMTEFKRVNTELRAAAEDLGKKKEVAAAREAAEARKKILASALEAETKARQKALSDRVDELITEDAEEGKRRAKQQASMDAAADARARERTGTRENVDTARQGYLTLLSATDEYYDAVAQGSVLSTQRVLFNERSTFSQREQAIRRLAQLDGESAERKHALRYQELSIQLQMGEITEQELNATWSLEDQIHQQRMANRMKERDIALEGISQERDARVEAFMAEQMQTQGALAHSAAMMVATPVVNELTGEMRALGDVNRDNYKEFSLFSDELPAIVAKKSQAIMAGIAAEAAGKAIFSIGEAAAMTAMGLGYLAIPGMQGQAGPAFASAAQHMVAAGVYGSIAGVSLGGAVGVGAMRGTGGLIPLTKAEREEMDRKKGDKSSDRLGGISDGGSEDPGARVLNIIVQNSAPIFGGDDTAAEMLALPLARASRSYFGSRMQEG